MFTHGQLITLGVIGLIGSTSALVIVLSKSSNAYAKRFFGISFIYIVLISSISLGFGFFAPQERKSLGLGEVKRIESSFTGYKALVASQQMTHRVDLSMDQAASLKEGALVTVQEDFFGNKYVENTSMVEEVE